MTEVFTIKQCLDGEISIDETVTVRGWVKTRRDSKAGLSFISLHDGSVFLPYKSSQPISYPTTTKRLQN